jgi:1-acyl-sn-glycerol-3-phosphate acyltransferase
MVFIMRTLVFYTRLILAGTWFAIACIIGLCLTPFRWKDPSLGAVFARIVYWGTKRALSISINIENQSRLYTSQPCIYVVNHQSNLDMFTMTGMYPHRTVVIGKKELKYIPLFGIFFVGTGNIMIDRQDRAHALAGLNTARDAIRERGLSIWIFPEGTRNYGAKELLPFKKGAFHLAVAAQAPLVPIVHQLLHTYYDPEKKRIGQTEIKIKVLESIPTVGMTAEDLPRLMDEVRQKMQAAIAELPLQR